MKTLSAVILSCYLVALLGAESATGEKNTKPISVSGGSSVFYQENSSRKGMDIYLSYDQTGKVSKVTIKSNQKDAEGKLPVILKREAVLAVIEEVLPEVERGALLRQYTGAYNRQGYGETSVYEKVQIDLSIVCRDNFCGVGGADVRLKQ
jgi:hypothetical protein